jgi:FtsP/CotA-like multicopper oxidase with cupredoxin domain
MVVIASDSFDLQPVSVDAIVSNSGERYDFVVNANQVGGKPNSRVCQIDPSYL